MLDVLPPRLESSKIDSEEPEDPSILTDGLNAATAFRLVSLSTTPHLINFLNNFP